MLRTVSFSSLPRRARPARDRSFSVAVADGAYDRSELLTVRHEDGPLDVTEIKTAHGGRMHRVLAPAGRVVVDYHATVTGQADPPPIEDVDLVEYRRPSRYADSDRLLAFARDQFRGLDGQRAARRRRRLGAPGTSRTCPASSLPTDGATDTLLKRRGVCRDFAHLVVALLRACDVPARLASVYAPGLKPMDFHAVAEAYVDGAWHVVDATAPRAARVAAAHRDRARRDRHRVPLVLRRAARTSRP